jgi:threonine dehydrogenase-like Zn-dependent dehydrogenase
LLNGSPPRLSRDLPRPARPAGEARVRMRLAGICDTDPQLARGYMGHEGVLGHEFVGDVLEADDASWVGRRVVGDINAGCGACPDCLERGGHHCPRRTVLGILGRNGALSEELVLPERCLRAVPDSVSDEQAVFAEPLAAALHVLDAHSAGPVTVLGDGKLGLLIALALRGAGVDVTLVGHHPEKLGLARAQGARAILERDIDPARDAGDVTVEATGSAAGLARALELCRPRGTLILKSTVAGETSPNLAPVVVNELTLVGSRCGRIEGALEVLQRGTVDPRPLISERFPLAEAERALARASEKGVLKVLVENG